MEDEQNTPITDEDVEAHRRSREAVDEGGEDEADVEAHSKIRGAADEGDSPDVEGHAKTR